MISFSKNNRFKYKYNNNVMTNYKLLKINTLK